MKIKKVMYVKDTSLEIYYISKQGEKLMLNLQYDRLEFGGCFGRYLKAFKNEHQIATINVDDITIKRI